MSPNAPAERRWKRWTRKCSCFGDKNESTNNNDPVTQAREVNMLNGARAPESAANTMNDSNTYEMTPIVAEAKAMASEEVKVDERTQAVPRPHHLETTSSPGEAIGISITDPQTHASSQEVVTEQNIMPDKDSLWVKALDHVEKSIYPKIVEGIKSLAEDLANDDTSSPSKLQKSAEDITVRLQQMVKKCEAETKEKNSESGKERILALVRDSVDKTVTTLNTFISVGDIVSSFDPVHAALPWAAVRFVLITLTSASKLESEIAICITKVATLIFQCHTYQMLYNTANASLKSHSDALDRLEGAIIGAYIKSLLFLSFAFCQYKGSGITAVFKLEELEKHTQNLHNSDDELAQAADNCEKYCNYDARGKLGKLLQLTKYIYRTTRNQGQFIVDIHQDIYLSKLKWVEGAHYDSTDNDKDPKCHEDTRIDLLNEIQNWIDDTNGKPVYWLRGKAGTGKSTVSRTIAKRLSEAQELGASFFFKRGEGDRARADYFFSTISHQLCHKRPKFAQAVAQAIRDDPDIATKAISQQFIKLVLEPLKQLPGKFNSHLRILVVVDALDECDQDVHVRTIISLLPQIKDLRNVGILLRFFMTSRPELHILSEFTKLGSFQKEVLLDEISQDVIRKDIYTYLRSELFKIKENYNSESYYSTLPNDWPGNERIQKLTDMATPLFIFAATVCRLLRDSPDRRLRHVLENSAVRYDDQLNETYLAVLRRFTAKTKNSYLIKEVEDQFQTIVGSIVLLEEPLSVPSLAKILTTSEREIMESDIMDMVISLDAILKIPPPRSTSPVRIFHLSFYEFLVAKEPNVAQEFHVDQKQTHGNLMTYCLDLLLKPGNLRKDICDLGELGKPRHQIQQETIDKALPPEVQYACRYWVSHLKKSKAKLDDHHQAYGFLQKYFLYWLEALSLMGRMPDSIGLIQDLLTVVVDPKSKVKLFLDDANRFLLTFLVIVDQTPLQLYSSAILFCPEQSIIRQLFQDCIDDWIIQKPMVEKYWNPCLQTFDGHDSGASSVSFSGDGKLIASGSFDETIKIWDVATGVLRYTLEGHTNAVKSVAFSGDGKLIVSGSWDRTIKVWDVAIGSLQTTLENHDMVKSVAFSSDNKLIASGPDDGAIKIWDAITGELKHTLDGHRGWVNSVAFSADCQLLASGADDSKIKVWDPATGNLEHTLDGHTQDVNSVAFSNDGRLIASGSDDKTIKVWDAYTGKLSHTIQENADVCSVAFSGDSKSIASGLYSGQINLWDTATGELRQTFEGHTSRITSITFQPNSNLLASASQDNTIKIWDTTKQSPQKTHGGHTDIINSIVFSPDTKWVASGSGDKTVKIWDAKEGTVIYTLRGHSGYVRSVAFSSDNSLVTSGSDDWTVNIWDANKGIIIHTLEVGEPAPDVSFSTASQLCIKGAYGGNFIANLFKGQAPSILKVIDTMIPNTEYRLNATIRHRDKKTQDWSLTATV